MTFFREMSIIFKYLFKFKTTIMLIFIRHGNLLNESRNESQPLACETFFSTKKFIGYLCAFL